MLTREQLDEIEAKMSGPKKQDPRYVVTCIPCPRAVELLAMARRSLELEEQLALWTKERENLREAGAWAYQLAGAKFPNAHALDNLSAVLQGRNASYEWPIIINDSASLSERIASLEAENDSLRTELYDVTQEGKAYGFQWDKARKELEAEEAENERLRKIETTAREVIATSPAGTMAEARKRVRLWGELRAALSEKPTKAE